MEWFVEVRVMALVLAALVTILVICQPSDEEREELREQKRAYTMRPRDLLQRLNVILASLIAALFFVDLGK